jgi:hypothetical protein
MTVGARLSDSCDVRDYGREHLLRYRNAGTSSRYVVKRASELVIFFGAHRHSRRPLGPEAL